MYGIQVILAVLLLRVVVPLSVLLWIGEAIRRRQIEDFRRISGQA